jgi:arabinosaccharide transport system substrate-binding protein
VDVSQLTTWDAFMEVGRRISIDRNGDGAVDTYMIDLPHDGQFGIQVLLQQRGGSLWDDRGRPAFDNQAAIDTVCWYVRATRGPQRIAFSAGGGQTLAKTMIDGVALFYLAADWRTKAFANDMPQLSGKLRLMPLPAWTPGGRQTSSWGGTGMAMTRTCTKPDLAWDLVKWLYLNRESAARNFRSSNILSPDRESWSLPTLDEPDPFYGGQQVGRFFAKLAEQVPAVSVSPWETLARNKLNEAVLAAGEAYLRDPATLESAARLELVRCADYVRRKIERTRLLVPEATP